MTLTVSYFSWVRERMGLGEEAIELPPSVSTIAGLVEWLVARDERGARAFADVGRIRAAIDGAMAMPSASITGAREVALFPPVTGG